MKQQVFLETGSCVWLMLCPLWKWGQRTGKITTTLTSPINLWHGITCSYLLATAPQSATCLLSSFAGHQITLASENASTNIAATWISLLIKKLPEAQKWVLQINVYLDEHTSNCQRFFDKGQQLFLCSENSQGLNISQARRGGEGVVEVGRSLLSYAHGHPVVLARNV